MFLNILATSPSAQTSARNLDTNLLICQIATVACLMSAYRIAGVVKYERNDRLYTLVPPGHPYLRWLRKEAANLDWLMDYGVMLIVEYGIRTGRKHEGAKYILNFVEDFGSPVGLEPQEFYNRAFDNTFDFRYTVDTHLAYRHYVSALWSAERKKLSWGDRMPPSWFIEYQLQRAGKELQSDTTGNGKGGSSLLPRAEGISKGSGSNPSRDV